MARTRKDKTGIRKLLRNPRYMRKREIELREELTPEELFSSDGYSQVMEAIGIGLSEAYGYPFRVKVVWDKSKSFVALVKRDCIGQFEAVINANDCLTSGKGLTLEQLHHANIAKLMHEGGHVRYTPFLSKQKMVEDILKGGTTLPLKEETKKLLENKRTAEKIAKIFMKLTNAAEDGFLEPRQIKDFPGYAPCLKLLRSLQVKDCTTLQEQKAEGLSLQARVFNAYLVYAKYSFVPVNADDMDEETEEILDILEPVFPMLDIIQGCLDPEERLTKELITVEDIISRLISLDDEEKTDEKKAERGKKESDETTDSAESGEESSDLDKLLDDLLEHTSATGDSFDESESSKAGTNGAGGSTSSVEETAVDLEAAKDAAAKEMAAKEAMRGLRDNYEDTLSDMDIAHIHEGRKIEMVNPSTTPSDDFEQLKSETRTLLRRLTSEFDQQITDMKDGAVERGLFFGPRLDAVYRTDLKKFSRDIAPDDIPDMSFVWLIDLSGSTCGGKIKEFRKLAFTMYQFCQHFGIRCYIYGHDEKFYDDQAVRIYVFADPDNPDGKALERISNMTYADNNRDGLPLQFACEQLLSEDSKNLYCVVISDGEPFADGYRFATGKTDIQNVIKKYSKLGINFITAGVGSDAESIKDIYCDGLDKSSAKYLSIENPTTLAKTFIGVLKEKMLS